MNLYFHDFQKATLSTGKGLMSFEPRISNKPEMVASLFEFERGSSHKADFEHRFMAIIDEMVLFRGLTILLVKLLAVVVWSSLKGLDRYNPDRLVYEGSDIGLTRILENIEGNIVE